MLEHLRVELGERSYPLVFGEDLRSNVVELIQKLRNAGSKVVVVADSNIAKFHPAWSSGVFGDAARLELAGGEATKSLSVLGSVLEFFAEQKLDRRSVVVAMGGGVLGDLAGFAASIYLRGLEVVQIPTTLLAMVDSAVGGKTGINLAAGKNLVGTFHQPTAVFVSTGFLGTLPQREFAAGVAEILKCGLLGDRTLFESLAASPLVSPSDPRLSSVIRSCCALKARIVRDDERETARDGGRALLNLGHTFGHALEQATGYARYLHGEAVAIGLVCAARYSTGAGLLDESQAARIEAAVKTAGLPSFVDPPIPASQLVAAMRLDKKARSGAIRLVVLHGIGDAALIADADENRIRAVWQSVGAS